MTSGVRRWPLFLIAPAAVAVWSGWVGLGELCGFGIIHRLPGIWPALELNTAITLPVGVEAYRAYALGAWLAPAGVPERVRVFARRSAIGAPVLGMAGPVIYHLLAAAHATRAPWPVVVLVSCMPVVTLGFGAALTHLLRAPAPAPVPVPGVHPSGAPALANGHGAPEGGQDAARIYAAELSRRELPSVRRVRREMHLGQPRATGGARVPRNDHPYPVSPGAGQQSKPSTRPGSLSRRRRPACQPITSMTTRTPNVVPLRAEDAGTETRTVESPGPAYTDLSDGRAQRKAIIPGHWRTWEAAREHVKLAAARYGHAARLPRDPRARLSGADRLVGAGRDRPHPERTPGVVACAGPAPAGAAGRRGRAAVRPSADSQGGEGNPPCESAGGLILLGCAVVVAALAILASAPLWAWVPVAAATGPLLARAGRPAHKPIVTAATLPGTVQAPSQDVITRALGSLGIAGIDRWLRDGRELVFPSPVRADHAREGGRAYRPPQSGEAVAPRAALVGRDGAAGLGAAVIVIGAYLVGASGR